MNFVTNITLPMHFLVPLHISSDALEGQVLEMIDGVPEGKMQVRWWNTSRWSDSGGNKQGFKG